MRLTRGKGALAAVLPLLVLLGAAAPASADVKVVQVKTQVRFLEVNRMTYMDFSGAISTKKTCRDERDVNLFYEATPTATPQLVGTATTDKAGAFLVQLSSPAVAGYYGAEIELDIDVVRHGHDKTKFRCKPRPATFYSF
jgi:hypothetical protein